MKTFEALKQDVTIWAYEKGIMKSAKPVKQAEKTLEETGELLIAVAREDIDEVSDAIGDILVTLIIQAEMQELDIVECLSDAYDVIKNRQGKMVDGKFVKEPSGQ